MGLGLLGHASSPAGGQQLGPLERGRIARSRELRSRSINSIDRPEAPALAVAGDRISIATRSTSFDPKPKG
jgi:hypothetical protein